VRQRAGGKPPRPRDTRPQRAETPVEMVAAPEPAATDASVGPTRLDRIAVALIAVVLLIAPLWATGFPTPGRAAVATPDALAVEGMAGVAMEVWGAPLSLILLAAAFIVVAVREWRRPVALGAVSGLGIATGLLGVWAIFSAAPNPVLYVSLNALAALYAALLTGGMASRLGRDPRMFSVLVLTIALAGSVIAGIGVREYLGELREGNIDHRTFSTFGPDFLAGYLLLTLPLTLAAFTSTSRPSFRPLLGLGIALQAGCLFLTGSRAGTAIALLAVAVWTALTLLADSGRRLRGHVAAAVGIAILGSVVSAAPILGRYGVHQGASKPATKAQSQLAAAQSTEDSQAHSGEFRKHTWTGTVRMAMRNPIVGTGIGSFALAYPRYGDTSFTAHAHNALLQWTAETGFPGALLALVALGAGSAYLLHALLRLYARRRGPPAGDGAAAHPPRLGDGEVARGPDANGSGAGIPPDEAPAPLLCGMIAALAGSLLHNMFDSDLYVVATLVTFCAVFGLAIALARSIAPETAERTRTVGREIWAIGIICSAFLLVRGSQIGLSRWERAEVEAAPSGAEAIELARAAKGADGLDPEPRIRLSQLLAPSPEAEMEMVGATRVAPTGMTYYKLGLYYREAALHETDRLKMAALTRSSVEAFERARMQDPHNLQVLRALGEEQLGAGVEGNEPELVRQAKYTYESMVALQTAPFGTVRAMPELIETDFAFAHDGLAEIAMHDNQSADAAREYKEALRILREYWPRRNWLINLNRTPEKRAAIAGLYEQVLSRMIQALNAAHAKRDAAALQKELDQMEADKKADEANGAAPTP